MQFKDILTLVVGSVALVISLITFFFNVYQKWRDNRRTFRKELTDVIKEIVETQISVAKLQIDNKATPTELFDLKRSYNTRRRYLIRRAEFLISDISGRVDHVDYNVLATACISAGFFEQADEYYRKSLVSSSGIEQIYFMRGYARFLYRKGNFGKGAEIYDAAIELLTSKKCVIALTVAMRETVDTYLWFAESEYAIDHFEFAAELLKRAEAMANTVELPFLKKELLHLIDQKEYLASKSSTCTSSL